jgi:hypothetical protein
MSKKKSRFNIANSAGPSWAKVELFAVRNPSRRRSSKRWKRFRAERDIIREADALRQDKEQGLDWDPIRFLLANNPRLTLDAAKKVVGSLTKCKN